MRNLLRKIHFGHILRKFSLNRPIIRLKFAQNLPQTGFPSLRFSFSDSLLGFGALAIYTQHAMNLGVN